ncbi:MAG: hypothetical protein JNJ45_06905 [Chthonomonas sp.]|nr:hypothetical protein [Chthonomonas sp.]
MISSIVGVLTFVVMASAVLALVIFGVPAFRMAMRKAKENDERRARLAKMEQEEEEIRRRFEEEARAEVEDKHD